jgi:uroporphyrinogen decarboxylase
MSKFLDLFQGETFFSPPLWFMRQAGRHLPEYQNIRKTCKTFLDLCYTPSLAAQVTLQPLERFDYDAAILFSDILVIPDALGQEVSFEEGEGPRLSPLSLSSFSEKLSFKRFFEKLTPVYEAISLIRSQLRSSKAFLGFAGAPWTLALYMLEGMGGKDFAKAKVQAFQQEKGFSDFLDFLTEAITLHLTEQVKAGVHAVQLFDTWAGHCPATHFQKWVLQPTQKIVTALGQAFPQLPIIGFPKGIGAQLLDYGSQSGVSALSLDTSTPLAWANLVLPKGLIFQGNLDPLLLVSGGDPLKKAIESIHEGMGERPYIFNLGHGILPQTPIANIEACVKWVRELK